MNKSQIKVDKHDKNIYYYQEKGKKNNIKKWKNIFCMNISSEEFIDLHIGDINMNYLIEKFLVGEIKDCKIKFYNGILRRDRGNFFKKNEHYEIGKDDNQLFIKKYNDYIEKYCQQYRLEIIHECESNDFIKMNSYKLVVGLGNPNVLETSITLHPIYGIPYIPGQSIKGTMRNYFLNNYYDIENKNFHVNEKKYNFKALYKYIFGDDTEGDNNIKGGVIFFDTFPSLNKGTSIETDVMTPHYRKYYSENGFPKDDDDPNPILFYVLKNISFYFPIAVDKNIYEKYKSEYGKINKKFIEYNEFKKFIYDLLKKSLEENGLGAKTAVGYGHFNDNNLDKKTIERQLEELQNKFNKRRY